MKSDTGDLRSQTQVGSEATTAVHREVTNGLSTEMALQPTIDYQGSTRHTMTKERRLPGVVTANTTSLHWAKAGAFDTSRILPRWEAGQGRQAGRATRGFCRRAC